MYRHGRLFLVRLRGSRLRGSRLRGYTVRGLVFQAQASQASRMRGRRINRTVVGGFPDARAGRAGRMISSAQREVAVSAQVSSNASSYVKVRIVGGAAR